MPSGTTRKPAAKKTAAKKPATRSGNPQKRAAAAAEALINKKLAEMATELTPTPASEWGKRSVGFVIELPSGNVARVKRALNILAMLESGRIPNPLAGVLSDAIHNQGGNLKFDPNNPDDMRAVEQYAKFLDEQCCDLFIEPRLVIVAPGESAPEGAVATADVDFEDKQFVYAFAQGGSPDVSRFREEQAAGMASLQHGEGISTASK